MIQAIHFFAIAEFTYEYHPMSSGMGQNWRPGIGTSFTKYGSSSAEMIIRYRLKHCHIVSTIWSIGRLEYKQILPFLFF